MNINKDTKIGDTGITLGDLTKKSLFNSNISSGNKIRLTLNYKKNYLVIAVSYSNGNITSIYEVDIVSTGINETNTGYVNQIHNNSNHNRVNITFLENNVIEIETLSNVWAVVSVTEL